MLGQHRAGPEVQDRGLALPPDVVVWAKKAQNGVLFVSEELATFFQEEKKFNTTWEGDSVGMVRLLAMLDKIDLVLLMSVNPGFGGQKFIPSALSKLQKTREMIRASGREIRLEIDGGVKVDNIGEIAAAGADTFVAGSAIFGSKDYRKTISDMRAAIAKATA